MVNMVGCCQGSIEIRIILVMKKVHSIMKSCIPQLYFPSTHQFSVLVLYITTLDCGCEKPFFICIPLMKFSYFVEFPIIKDGYEHTFKIKIRYRDLLSTPIQQQNRLTLFLLTKIVWC